MENNYNIFLKRVINLAKVELIMLIIVTIWWYFIGYRTITGYSNTLFGFSTIAMCLGLAIALSNKSLRHLYKHLRAKDKGKTVSDAEFAKSVEKRNRYSNYGALLSISGIVGMVISAILAFA